MNAAALRRRIIRLHRRMARLTGMRDGMAFEFYEEFGRKWPKRCRAEYEEVISRIERITSAIKRLGEKVRLFDSGTK
jgi:hypothetical protein